MISRNPTKRETSLVLLRHNFNLKNKERRQRRYLDRNVLLRFGINIKAYQTLIGMCNNLTWGEYLQGMNVKEWLDHQENIKTSYLSKAKFRNGVNVNENKYK